MKKSRRARLIAIFVSLALLLLSIPIISYADGGAMPEQVSWDNAEGQGSYEAWTESENTNQMPDAGQEESSSEESSDGLFGSGEEEEQQETEEGVTVVTANKAYELLTAAYPEIKLDVTPEKWFGEPTRAENGDVTEIVVGNMKVLGEDIQEIFELEFSNFSFTYTDGKGFEFTEFTGEVTLPNPDETENRESEENSEPESQESQSGDEGEQQGEQQDGPAAEATPQFSLLSPPMGYSLTADQVKAIKEVLTVDFLFQNATPNASVIRGGDTALLYPYITVAAGKGDQLDASRMTVVITPPDKDWLTVKANQNSWYKAEESGKDIVLSLLQLPEPGAGDTQPPLEVGTVNGILPEGEELKFTIKIYYDQEELFVVEPYFTIKTDYFQWYGASNSVGATSITVDATDTLPSNPTFNYSIANSVTNQNGRSYAQKIELEQEIEVSEHILLTQDILDAAATEYGTNGMTNHYQVAKNVEHDLKFTVLETYSSGNIKKFRMNYTINNKSLQTDNPADLSNTGTMYFQLRNLKINRTEVEKLIETDKDQYTIEKAFAASKTKFTVTPFVETTSSYVTSGAQTLEPTTTPQINVVYKKSLSLDPNDPNNPLNAAGITKTLTKVENANRKYVYGGETMTFTIGGFGNALKAKSLTNYKVTDEFQREDMYPITLTTGTYNMSNPYYFSINIIMTDNSVKAISNIRYNSNTTYRLADHLANDYSLSDIAKIEFVYGAVPAGWKVNTAPTITMMARAKPQDKAGDELTNTAKLSYTGDVNGAPTNYPEAASGHEALYTSSDYATYTVEIQNDDKLNKDVRKIRGSAGTGKAVNDLLEYTVQFRNTSGDRVQNPFFDDEYYGQEPYLTDSLGVMGGYGTAAPFIKIVSVYDYKGTDVTAARGLSITGHYVGSDPGQHSVDPPMKADMLRIRLKGILNDGDVVKVSYIMKVTTPAEVKNNFNAYAYPIGNGQPVLIYLGNGHIKPGALTQVLPAITSKVEVHRAADKVLANTETNGGGMGEDLDVTLTITSNSDASADSLTMNSVLHQLQYGTTYYQDAVQRLDSSVKATISHYGKDNTLKETKTNIPYTAGTSSSWKDYSYSSYFLERGMFKFADSPIILAPGEYVVVKYKLKVTSWQDVSKRYKYMNLAAYATFREASNKYTVSTGFVGGDGESTTQSRNNSCTAQNIFIRKNTTDVFAGIQMVNTSTVTLNGATPYAGFTNIRVDYFNYSASEQLKMSKLIIQMPEYQTFKAISTLTASSSSYKFDVISPAGEQQVVAISKTDNSDIVVAPGGVLYFYFNTEISPENNAKIVAKDNPATHSSYYIDKNFPFRAGFYSNQIVQTTTTNPIAVESNSSGEWGTSYPGNLYRSTNVANARLRVLFASPGITTRPMKISTSGEYIAAGANEKFAMGQRVAWEVVVQEHPSALPTLAKPYVVLKLPVGMKYENIVTGALSATEKNVGGVNYVVVELENVTTSTKRTVIIESTGGIAYGDMQAEAYAVVNEHFYTVYSGSRVQPPFKFSDLGIPNTVFQDAVVNANSKINVSGAFAFTSSMRVDYKSKNAVSAGPDTLEAERDGDTLTYKMILNNGGNDKPYEDLVLINRLPAPDDKYNLSNALRGSNTKVTMLSAPEVHLDGNKLIEGTGYTVSYTNAAPSQEFSHGDYGKTDVTPKASWSATMANATAFRITMKDSLAAGKKLEVTFKAKADPANIPSKNALAVDNFGFGFNASFTATKTWVTSEAVPVKVSFPNLKPATLKGTLFEDNDSDGILNNSDAGYTGSKVKVHLINAANVKVAETETDLTTGEYSFLIEAPGAYTVKIPALPDGYTVFDTIKAEEQGNKFKLETDYFVTETINVALEQTYTANAALVPDADGQLTITKTVTGESRVGGDQQSFLFRVDYKPINSSETITFYEVIKGPGSRTIVDLPRGTYTVTEISSWSTGFSPAGGTTFSGEITYSQSELQASFTNKRDVENYFHAIADALNKFKK